MAAEDASSVLPESHKWPQAYCPKVAHDAYLTGLELPIVDLSEERQACLKKLEHACKEWGFFQLVNHGVAPDLVRRMEWICKSFFSLPVDEKMRITEEGTKFVRLYDCFTFKQYTACSWVEGLNIHDSVSMPHIASRAWPECSQDICSTFSRYCEEMLKLGKHILHLLVESLGVDESTASVILNGCGFTGTRFNFYPSCPNPSKTLGISHHTDLGCVTILHQDDVGGLQIAKEGNWIAVKPIPNAFVINIGDSFQAWSNCRYKSVEHRVVVNRQKPRISIAFFYGPTGDYNIEAPNELIDEKHPIVYRPFCYKDYLGWRRKTHLIGKQAFETFASRDFRN